MSISRSRATKQDDDLSTSEGKRVDSRSYDEIGNVNTSHTDSPEKIKGRKEKCRLMGVRCGSIWRWCGFQRSSSKATEFFAGYLLEQSFSVDNLFVFVLIFKYFKVPIMYQNRVFSYGIAGAIIFRLTLILLRTATLQRFEAVNLFLTAVLLYSSFTVNLLF